MLENSSTLKRNDADDFENGIEIGVETDFKDEDIAEVKQTKFHRSNDEIHSYKPKVATGHRSAGSGDPTIPRHRRGNSSGPPSGIYKLNIDEDNTENNQSLTGVPLISRNSGHSRHSSANSELRDILANSPNSPRTTTTARGAAILTKTQAQLAVNSIIGFEGNTFSISLFKVHIRTGSDLFIRKVQERQQLDDHVGEESLFKLYHDTFLDNIEQKIALQEVDMRDSESVFQIITNSLKKDVKIEDDIFFNYAKSRPQLNNLPDAKIRVYASALEETLKELCVDFLEYKILAERLRAMLDIKADQSSIWTQINPFIAAALGAVPLSQVQINSNDNNDTSYEAIQNFCLAFFSLASTMLSYRTHKLELLAKDWETKYANLYNLIIQIYSKKICWFAATSTGDEKVIWDQTTEKFDFTQVIFMHAFMLLKKNNYLQYDKLDEEFALNLLGALLNRFLSSNIASSSKPNTLDDAEYIANIVYKSYVERLDKLNCLTRKFSSIHPPSELGLRNHIISYFRFNQSMDDKIALIKNFPEAEEKEDLEIKAEHKPRSKERGDINAMSRKLGSSGERRRRSLSPALPEQVTDTKLLSPRRKKSDSDLEVVNKVETLREIRSNILHNYLHTAWYEGIEQDNPHYNVMESMADNILSNSSSQNLYLVYIPIALTANYISGLSLLGLISNAFTTMPYTALCMCFSIVGTLINNYVLTPYLDRIDDNKKCYLEFESTLKMLLNHEGLLSLNEKVYSANTLVAQASQRNLQTQAATAKEIFNASPALKNINIIMAETFLQLCTSSNSKVGFLYRHQQASLAMSLYTTLCQSALSNDTELKPFLCNMSTDQAKQTGEAIAKSLRDEGTVQECRISLALKMMPCCKAAPCYLKINAFEKDSFVDTLRKMAYRTNGEMKKDL